MFIFPDRNDEVQKDQGLPGRKQNSEDLEESKMKPEGVNPLLTKSRSSENNIIEGGRNESATSSNRTTEEIIGDVVKRQ